MYGLVIALVYAGILLVLGKEEAVVVEKATEALFYLYIIGSVPYLIIALILPPILTLGGRKIGKEEGHSKLGTIAGATFGIWAVGWFALRRTALISGAYLLMQDNPWGIALIAGEILLGWYLKKG